MTQVVRLQDTPSLPAWRRPIVLLALMAVAMPLSFATWSALLNNFVVEAAQFDGADIGWLHSVREIPGFLAVGVIFVLLFVREQSLAMISLCLLGVATAITALFPSMGGLLFVTLISSIGYHYYETVNQSLQLQWLPKDRAPQVLGQLIAIGSAATLAVYVLIDRLWDALGLTYHIIYMVSGGATLAIVAFCILAFPQFESPTPQIKKMVLRKRYWLYYALQFMSGARRQIFLVFAGFMMVERFGYAVDDITRLMMVTLVANMVVAPVLGRVVAYFGERKAMAFEYIGLTLVFLAYGGLYWFGWGVAVAACLYVINNIFFALALAMKTYFQKIADPADIAPTAAVAFTINHIAAVFLPAGLGYIWLVSPGAVFALAAVMAFVSLCLALLIPRHPTPGNETILSGWGVTRPAE